MLKSYGFSRRTRRNSGRAPRGGRAIAWARLSVIAAAAAILAIAAVRLGAASATFWTVSTQADFLKGDAEDVSIDSDGRLFLGPSPSLVAETSAPFLWTAILGADGTMWAGSGNEGQVLKVSKDGKLSIFFDATELEVHALAPAPNGGLYVGTSPDGKIYQVNADGTSRTFFDPDDKYIWSLAVDKSGNVFAATGDKGIIYKITPDGHGTPFYRTNAGNVVALAFTKAGDLIAGTESPGRVFKIDTAGKAFVLLDSPFREIHAVRLADDGTIYAVAVNGTQGGESRATDPLPVEPPTRQPVASVSTEITAITVVDSSVGASPSPMPRPSKKQGRGAIYRIRPDGLWDVMWDSGEDAPYDIVIEPSGSLLVGTGTEGKIFRVSGDPARATLLARAAARQVTTLLREPSGRIIGAASNPGKLFALSPAAAKRGTFESDVRDAGTVASWGVIRWRAAANSGAVNVFSRSGNTATPDETWSPWSSAYTNAGGEQIVSPTARYLQWRAVLTSSGESGPVLTSVTTAYLPRNLRPEVSSITVHPSGTVFQRPFSTGETELAGFDDAAADVRFAAQSAAAAASGGQPGPGPALGRRIYQKGLQTFVWKADDDNDDRLQFDILYRREGETSWKVLHRGLTDPIFVWDTTSVPDGTYFVKVSASDALSNSPGAALVGELESVSFDIDNTAPRIDLQPATRTGARTTITFTVRDEQSSVQRVEYSLDASRWRLAYPKDGIADSRREDFEVRLDEGEAARSVIIRATDAMNNVATGVAEIKR
jgi:WD40 repeat protein